MQSYLDKKYVCNDIYFFKKIEDQRQKHNKHCSSYCREKALEKRLHIVGMVLSS